MSPPEIREASFASRLVTKSIVFLPYKHFPDFRWWFINLSQTIYGGRAFGAVPVGRNWKRIFEKTRVGFGRTELSLRLSCTEFCALSSGHGPRGEGFYEGSSGADFCIFWVFRKIAATCPENKQKNHWNHWKNQRKISWNLRKPMDFKGKVQNKLKSRQKVCKICEKILHLGGVPPPRFRNNMFWQILHTFCLLFNLFWTFPLKSIGFLRFQLIFRWLFKDFTGFSAYSQDILQRSIAEIEWIPHTKGWPP